MISFHKMKRYKFFLALGLLPLLQGCDTLRSTFGLDHYQPDAFNISTNPPLILPPEYNLLPPVEGAKSPYAQTSSSKAQTTLNISSAKSYTNNQSERGLINNVKNDENIPENIRDILEKEAEEENTFSGKVKKQLDTWKNEAKKNLGSINNSSPSPEEGKQLKTT